MRKYTPTYNTIRYTKVKTIPYRKIKKNIDIATFGQNTDNTWTG